MLCISMKLQQYVSPQRKIGGRILQRSTTLDKLEVFNMARWKQVLTPKSFRSRVMSNTFRKDVYIWTMN